MRRILLKIAYDGTNYNGWQEVSTGKGIEEVINLSLSDLLPLERPKVIGASRTDAGVHADCNICVFDTNSNIKEDKFTFALNDRLPLDIRVRESKEVDKKFHPRKNKSIKTYLYKIYTNNTMDPLQRLYSFYVFHPINTERMIEASKYLIGEHDFKSFCNPEAQIVKNNLSTIRHIYDINIKRNDNIIEIEYIGDGFLYHMVRIITGSLLRVGMNMWEPIDIQKILLYKDRKYAGPTAPALGLTLKKIDYIK